MAEASGCTIEIAEGSSADQRSYRVDFSKLARTLPESTFEWDAARGARELTDAYRAAGLTGDDFDGDLYVRIRRLTSLLDAQDLTPELRWRDATAVSASRSAAG